MNQYLWGVLTALSATVALFFLKFARDAKDRLFAFFSAAFAVLALDWFLLVSLDIRDDSRHVLYLLRLLSFLLIIAAIIDKNRGKR
jgi:hypothetical protein